ncbi:MAG: hypothetical protein WBG90_02135 [Saonia sp.]
MKQRTPILLFLFLCLIYRTNAQDSTDYLEFNDRRNVVHGVYLGLTTHYGEINNKSAYFTGIKIAYVANQQFEVGLAVTGFYSEQDFFNTVNLRDEDLIGGYAGLHLEPIFFSKSRVNLSFPVLIGAGAVGYVGDNFDDDLDDDFDDADALFVLEPGVNMLFNVSRYLQLEAGFKYRFSNKIDVVSSDISRLNGFSAGLGIKVGIFNMGRNRYKKNVK